VSNVIFYFSGTGNSLSVAKKLAENIGDTVLYPIKKDFQFTEDLSRYEKIGFVFPVYYYHVPPVVGRFTKTLTFNKSHYIFCIAAFAGVLGFAHEQMSNVIESRGGEVSGQFAVRMPGNAIAAYGAFPQIMQKMLLKSSEKKIKNIAKSVLHNKTVIMKGPNMLVKRLRESTLNSIAQFGENAANFHCNDQCTLCGKCVKVCPLHNITITEKKVTWGNGCEQCMACIQWCPNKAINYADKTAKRKRYHHPEVTFQDIAGASS
jgi:ferredoxin